MINPKVQDEVNGSNKLEELKSAIGKEFSDNYSPTLRSVLLSVSKCGNICTVISVDAYGKQGGKVSKQPSYLTWNALFY
jgi:hypothetical protein